MVQSRLTVRTLAMAMVALVLACVHAARGDGRTIATISSGPRAGSGAVTRSGSSHGSGVVTVHGDPWKAGPDHRPSAKPRPTAGPTRVALNRPRRDPSAAHDEPVCIVRRVSGTEPSPVPAVPGRPSAAKAPVDQPPSATQRARLAASVQIGPPAPLARNAFALSPTMGARAP